MIDFCETQRNEQDKAHKAFRWARTYSYASKENVGNEVLRRLYAFTCFFQVD